jgi:environmental stress-induced protein Ves
MLRLIRASDYRRERWKNGLGWTNEVARGSIGSRRGNANDHGGVHDAWDWRLSIAEIDRDCVFSAFPGIDRTLVLLDGVGMTLRFADGEIVDLRTRGAQIDFAGERTLDCVLADGPTRDFNVMWRRDRLTATVAIRRAAVPWGLPIERGDIVAIHLLDGAMTCADGATSFAIDEGDTLVAQNHRAVVLRPEGEAQALVVRFGSPDG